MEPCLPMNNFNGLIKMNNFLPRLSFHLRSEDKFFLFHGGMKKKKNLITLYETRPFGAMRLNNETKPGTQKYDAMVLNFIFVNCDIGCFFQMLQATNHSHFDFTPLTPFPNKPWFFRVCITSLLKSLREKEKFLITSNFSFSLSLFYWFGEFSDIFIKFEIVVCKLSQFGRV